MGALTYLWSESPDAEMQSSDSLLCVVARAIAENTHVLQTSKTNDHSARKDSAEDTAALLQFFTHLGSQGYTVPWHFRDGSLVYREH